MDKTPEGIEPIDPEDDWQFDDDDRYMGDDVCPNCGEEYDEIDWEYQICHHCKFNNNYG